MPLRNCNLGSAYAIKGFWSFKVECIDNFFEGQLAHPIKTLFNQIGSNVESHCFHFFIYIGKMKSGTVNKFRLL